jgi:hypothetical protein
MAASQGMAAAGAVEEAVRPPAQRFRVNVPAADEAVLAWMRLQDNHSLSLRLLIRESIERNGYIDVMNRPVEQLPKRGRPALAEDAVQPEAAPAKPSPQPVQHPLPPEPAPVPVPAAEAPPVPEELDLSTAEAPEPELLGIALASADPAPVHQETATAPPAPAVQPPAGPEPSGPEPMDVNDVFASLR